MAALRGACGAVPGQPVLAGPARPDKVHVGGLFPVVPWVFLFWCGVFLARLWRPGRGEPPAALRPLCAIGRNTLLVYMLHQPVIYGALWVWHTVLG